MPSSFIAQAFECLPLREILVVPDVFLLQRIQNDQTRLPERKRKKILKSSVSIKLSYR